MPRTFLAVLAVLVLAMGCRCSRKPPVPSGGSSIRVTATYGDGQGGYYARVGRAAEVVVPAWRSYLDGKTDREAAVAQIVAGFTAGLKTQQ